MTKFGLYTSFYNSEKFIDKIFSYIESLNYDNFEWHVTDDFSLDNTKSILLERISNSPISHKIKYFEQNEKKQMYWKANEFFDLSFDWIVLIDSDDEIDVNCLQVYNKIIKNRPDLALLSCDFHKVNDEDKSLHSISYLTTDENISEKIKRYHPSCDYLNNISYSCYGLLRSFNHKLIDEFKITNNLACAEDSYHVFWSNSYGKYLNVPRPLYKWLLRKDSESHSELPTNFNDNFDIALTKLKNDDRGVDDFYFDVYLETCALMSYPWEGLKNKKVSLWSKPLTNNQKTKLTDLYFDSEISFNNVDSEIHVFLLNSFSSEDLNEILEKVKTNKLLFYYQNQNFHSSNENKDIELQRQLNYYSDTIQQHTGFSWWTYIRHFIIWN